MTKCDAKWEECGVDCAECDGTHPGCVDDRSKCLFRDCGFYACSRRKGLIHCGECDDFVCSRLDEFAVDEAYHRRAVEKLTAFRVAPEAEA